MDRINCSAFSDDNNVCRGRGMRELTVVTSPGSWSIGIFIPGKWGFLEQRTRFRVVAKEMGNTIVHI